MFHLTILVRQFLWLFAFLIAVLITLSPAHSQSNFIESVEVIPLSDLVRCDDLPMYERTACAFAASKIQGLLADEGIYIGQNEIVKSMSPIVESEKLNTGHSCSHRAWIQGSSADVALSYDADASFDGDLIGAPLVLTANLPVRVNAEVGIKESWGFKYTYISCSGAKCKKKKKCVDLATDHWRVVFRDEMVAKSVIAINLQPEAGLLPNGNYFVRITPIVFADFRFSGFDPTPSIKDKEDIWPAFLGPILTTPGSVTDYLVDWTRGDTVPARDDLYADIGYSLAANTQIMLDTAAYLNWNLSGVLGLEGPDVVPVLYDLGELDGDYALYEFFAGREIESAKDEAQKDVSRDLENKIYLLLARALDLDSFGQREWVFGVEEVVEETGKQVIPLINLPVM